MVDKSEFSELEERAISEPVTLNGYISYDIERPVHIGANNYKLCRFRVLKDSKSGKEISKIYLSGLRE